MQEALYLIGTELQIYVGGIGHVVLLCAVF